MKITNILLTASMLMLGAVGSWAAQPPIILHPGINSVGCQTVGTPNNNPSGNSSFMQFSPKPSDPNGVNNAVMLYWSGGGFNQYQYFTGADADNFFLNSDSVDGWYDGVGSLWNGPWNPGKGAFIYLPPSHLLSRSHFQVPMAVVRRIRIILVMI